jgi:tRNA-dihydrouridine synthase B
MKQFATYFTHGVRDGSKLRTEIYRAHDTVRILEIVERFFSEQRGQISAPECAEVA